MQRTTILALTACATLASFHARANEVATPATQPTITLSADATPGDADHTPSQFKITRPGRYTLSGNIVGSPGIIAIEIASSDVTLDLAGFSITGGLAAIVAEQCERVTLSRGTIESTQSYAINLSTCANASVEAIAIRSTQGSAASIITGRDATLTNCTVADAAGAGFEVGPASTLVDCKADRCAGTGFDAANAVSVEFRGCVASGNSRAGFAVGSFGRITGSTASQNGSDGITLNSHAEAMDNLCSGNGTNGDSAGIRVIGDSARIRGNRVHTNVNTGIMVLPGVKHAKIQSNWSRANTHADFDIAPGNDCATIMRSSGNADQDANFAF